MAASWVMLLHLQPISGPYLDQLPLLRPLIGAGWTGVELFFVLSGFVITLGYLDRVGARPTAPVVGRFLMNRFARIWPAWAVVTVIAGAWVWTVRSVGWDADVVSPHPDADLGSLLRQISMTHMWGYSELGGSSFVPPGWSISAEWTAYLLFPLAVVLIRPLRRLPAWLLMTGAVAVMSPLAVGAFVLGTPDLEQSWTLRIACGFTAGMLAALAYRRVPDADRTDSVALATVWTCLALVLAGTSWAAWAVWERGPGVPIDHYGVIVVLFPLLVVGLSLTARGPARWLGSAPMVYGGKLSYCLYLVHFLVLDIALTIWWQDPAGRGVINPGLVLAVPGLVLVSLVASAALHHGVEEPGRRLILGLQERIVPAPRPMSPLTTAEAPLPLRSPVPVPVPVPRAATVRRARTPSRPADHAAGAGVPRGPVAAPRPPGHGPARTTLVLHASTGRHAGEAGRTRETVRPPL